MPAEGLSQGVTEEVRRSHEMIDHGIKYNEVYVEHVAGVASGSRNEEPLMMEHQLSEGVTRETILAFIVCSFLRTVLPFFSPQSQAICGQLNAYEMTLLIPGSALSYINADLGPSPAYPWISINWALGAAVLVSISGRLADIFGRR